MKQKSVSLSTAESEWYDASEAGKELLYLRIIMREFGFPQLGPMHLYEDSPKWCTAELGHLPDRHGAWP